MSIAEQGVYPHEDETLTVLTWEIPMLMKYRFPMAKSRPFVEIGPSVRMVGNLNSADPSKHGATFGAGFELRAGKARLSPTFRYTRWARDSVRLPPGTDASQFELTLTNPSQFELLFGLSF